MNTITFQIPFAAAASLAFAGVATAGLVSSGPSQSIQPLGPAAGEFFVPTPDTLPTVPPTLPGVVPHSDIPDLPGLMPIGKKDGRWTWTRQDGSRPRWAVVPLDLHDLVEESGPDADPRNNPPPPRGLLGPSGFDQPASPPVVFNNPPSSFGGAIPFIVNAPDTSIPTPGALMVLGLSGLAVARRRSR